MNSTTTTTIADTSIHTRALLVWLTISTWSARKYDRKVSDKVNAEYAASQDAGRYNKHLLPGDAPAYRTLTTLAGAIRAWHYKQTLSWSDEGWRLLPTANYMEYCKGMREQQSAFDVALAEFVSDYPMLRARAQSLLNGLYRDEDYPSSQDIGKRFALGVRYTPLPAFGDIRVDLASDQIASIESQIARDRDAAVQVAVRDSWSRLHSVVERIAVTLKDPKAVFRNTLISNATEICDALQRLNITADPDLESMRKRALELTQFDPDILRDTPIVRARVASKADAILSQMSSFYTEAQS